MGVGQTKAREGVLTVGGAGFWRGPEKRHMASGQAHSSFFSLRRKMEYAPIVAAVGAGGYVGYTVGNRITNLRCKQMPGTGRPANQQGFRRKIRRPHLHGKVHRPIPGRSCRTRNVSTVADR